MSDDVKASAAMEPDDGSLTQMPEWHVHTRGYGPTQGHWHAGGDRPHQHDLDGFRWGAPEFLAPEADCGV